MQLSFDPTNDTETQAALALLGVSDNSDAGEASIAAEMRRLIDRLQTQLADKREEVAKLKAQAPDSATYVVSEATFAACILELPDSMLLRWPTIGKGGLAKMREYAMSVPGAEPAEARPESPTPYGPEETASTDDTSEPDDGGWGDEDEGPADESDEPLKTLEEIRLLVKNEFIAKKRVAIAKKIVAKFDAKNLDDLKPEDYDEVYARLTAAAKEG